MYITNLTHSRLGVNGTIILTPGEVNRYVNTGDPSIVVRLYKMQNAGLISIVEEEGLTKTNAPGKVVKLLGVEEEGVTKKPRSSYRKGTKKKVEEATETVEKEATENTME